MVEKKKEKIIKSIKSEIEFIEEDNKKKDHTNLDIEYKRLKKELTGLKKGLILRKYKKFKIFSIIALIILFLSIFFSIINLTFSFTLRGIIFSFNDRLWNNFFYFGLSIFTVSYIFYQIAESNKDRGRLMLGEMYIKRLSEIERIKKREQDIKKMLRAIDKLDSLKSVSDLRNTQDEDLKFMYDRVYVNALKTKLKSLKKTK